MRTTSLTFTFLIFFVSIGCQSQKSIQLVEKADVDGVIYERSLIDTVAGKVEKREYVLLSGDVMSLSIEACKRPSICHSDLLFNQLLENHLTWPSNEEVVGDIILSVLVDERGNLIEARVIKDITSCPSCSQRALNFLKVVDCWKPGECQGKRQEEFFYLKVPFRPYPAN